MCIVMKAGTRASYLNGKIGDIRAYTEDDKICEIHFEEEGFKPTKVKLKNVRILFELPDGRAKAEEEGLEPAENNFGIFSSLFHPPENESLWNENTNNVAYT
eukprot:scaffold2026_cov146-Skeletonema_marinoi.AAC.3